MVKVYNLLHGENNDVSKISAVARGRSYERCRAIRIHWIVIFSNCHRKTLKAMPPGILNSKELKSNFNSKMML